MIRRTQTIEFGAFMKGENKPRNESKERIKTVLVAAGMTLVSTPKISLAASPTAVTVSVLPADVKMKIIHAFDPLVNLMVSLSIPISSVMIAGAALMIMIGQKEKGYQLLMNCALGYVLVQMTPLFIAMLAGIGSAIGH